MIGRIFLIKCIWDHYSVGFVILKMFTKNNYFVNHIHNAKFILLLLVVAVAIDTQFYNYKIKQLK